MLREQFRPRTPIEEPRDSQETTPHPDALTTEAVPQSGTAGEFPGPTPMAGRLTPLDVSPLPPALVQLKEQVHRQLVSEIDQDALARVDAQQARREVRAAIAQMLTSYPLQGTGDLRHRLVEEILDEVLGFGPLDPLLRDETVSEIMVNGPTDIWVERAGRVQRAPQQFRDEEHLLRVIDRIVAPLVRRVDEASPMADARLPDGSRVNIVVPPASPSGAKITLRKFARQRLETEDLIRYGTLTSEAAEFLRACVAAELNVLVSGGTGTGKTTLLNVLSSYIDEHERLVTIEDPLELQLQQPHVVALEARPPGIEGTRQISQRDLVRNALRMRPDRVIVGEVRGGEAFDMLQAMNTGHDGAISTVHANTPRDALSRVENMVLMAGLDLPDHAIREQIASAIQLIVQVSRLPDGSRRVTHITEVVGQEAQTITLQDLFLFERDDAAPDVRDGGSPTVAPATRGAPIVGRLRPTGLQPHFLDRFERNGIPLPAHTLRSNRW